MLRFGCLLFPRLICPPARLRTSLYDDDAALFVNTSLNDIHQLAEILQLFGNASGLQANLAKSAIYPIRCDVESCSPFVTASYGCPSLSLAILGLPLHHRKITKSEIQSVIDKVAGRLPRWSGKLLNVAARLELINSVLTAIPTYMLTVFQLRKWAIKKIDKIKRDFLWKHKNDGDRGILDRNSVV